MVGMVFINICWPRVKQNTKEYIKDLQLFHCFKLSRVKTYNLDSHQCSWSSKTIEFQRFFTLEKNCQD